MQTIKTAIVVVLLLGVCYGAYVALNAPEPTLPPDLVDWQEGDLDMSVQSGSVIDLPELSTASSAPPDLQPLTPPALVPPPPIASEPVVASPDKATLTPPKLDLPTFPVDVPSKSSPESLSSKLSPKPVDPAFKEGESVPLPGALASTTAPALGSDTANPADLISSLDLPPVPPLPELGGPDQLTSAGSAPSTPDLLGATDGGVAPGGVLPPSASPSAAAGNSALPNDPKASRTAQPYAVAHKQALELASAGKLKDALALMSPYFDHISLVKEEHDDLRSMLDALAAEVIYSQRHLLESQFVVSPGETLESIANKFRISPETLANINRLGSTRVILPGTVLKVVRGPFRSEVDLSRSELVMYLGDLYAGIFPVTIGNSPKPELGSFTIIEKLRDKSYVTPSADFIGHSDPRNPYGGYWMHLGKDICIHGSAEVADPKLADAGCISLSPLDARDVYALLTQGSEVVIKE